MDETTREKSEQLKNEILQWSQANGRVGRMEPPLYLEPELVKLLKKYLPDWPEAAIQKKIALSCTSDFGHFLHSVSRLDNNLGFYK